MRQSREELMPNEYSFIIQVALGQVYLELVFALM